MIARHQPRRPIRGLRVALVLAVVALLAGSAEGALAKSLPGAPGCSIFPKANVWNRRVDGLPVRSDSATLIASIGPAVDSIRTSAPTAATASLTTSPIG